MFRKLDLIHRKWIRLFKSQAVLSNTNPYGWRVKPTYSLDPKIKRAADESEDGDQGALKRHPGAISKTCTTLDTQIPAVFHTAMCNVMDRHPKQKYQKDMQQFAHKLWKRQYPEEEHDLVNRANVIEQKFIDKNDIDVESMDEREFHELQKHLKEHVKNTMKRTTIKWKPIMYNQVESLTYMLSRTTSDYASLYRVLTEIKTRDPSFTPRTLLDLGSGIGTSVWAANQLWPKTIFEHMLVDSSEHMLDLSRLLLQGGEIHKEGKFPGVYFKGFLPASSENKFDLVISAYTLFEMQSQSERIRNIMSLWRKTEKYLIIMELGTFAGFRLVHEARDFILKLSSVVDNPEELPQLTRKQLGPIDGSLKGHVFAPCPHHYECPMLSTGNREPCNFDIGYMHQTIGDKKTHRKISRFSYVILKKGERSEEDPQWPRVIRENRRPSKRVVCHTCSNKGSLDVTTITRAKYGNELFTCAKASKWGDLLPVIHDEMAPLRKHAPKNELIQAELKEKTLAYQESRPSEEPFGTMPEYIKQQMMKLGEDFSGNESDVLSEKDVDMWNSREEPEITASDSNLDYESELNYSQSEQTNNSNKIDLDNYSEQN